MLPLVQSVFNNALPCKHCISTSVILYRAISELETQLEFERERREKLESQLDDYRAETSHLNLQIEELSYALQQANGVISLLLAFFVYSETEDANKL